MRMTWIKWKLSVISTKKVWSKPKLVMNDEQIIQYFSSCDLCLKEEVHICKTDVEIEAVAKYRDMIMKYEKIENTIKVPKMELLYTSDSDILKMIDKLSYASSCGPDGIESGLIKRLRIPLSINDR